ncbi:helix-turn-helix domain-containing protein [Agrobacterium pusense]|uniref:helix-turn-helix domain-containing protein n=1 Tax=Agrobacterium pusense TaxID=648995 RepID=UPI001EF0179C|nr:helix-turn-helix domain-containing protein [Agrobacterium pusense]MDH0873961.1 helix-turn-helix domain-containing protein [Agrobacterium pusense]MDH1271161.1 helix-turn-helix domain-containing protein [Agrobacterium pusense]
MFGGVQKPGERGLARRFAGRTSDQGLPAALQRAIIVMRETAKQPHKLPIIADRVAVSERSMDRLFHQYLGMSTGQYYSQIRLSHARARGGNQSVAL